MRAIRNPTMRIERVMALAMIALCMGAAIARDDESTATGPASRGPGDAPDPVQIARLVEKLGDADIQNRDAAEAQLQAFGDRITAQLMNHINHSDDEIAGRVESCLTMPADLNDRVRFAVRLIETARLSAIHKGVQWLMVSPAACIEPFKREVESAGALAKLAADETLDMMQRMADTDTRTPFLLEKGRQSQIAYTLRDISELVSAEEFAAASQSAKPPRLDSREATPDQIVNDALRLISTGRQDATEHAVRMLFERTPETVKGFSRKASGVTNPRHYRVAAVISARLTNLAESEGRILTGNEESRSDLARAAAWDAFAVMQDHFNQLNRRAENQNAPATKPQR
jgi:hypothetical protein